MQTEAIIKSAGYYDLRQALTEPGCALCRLLARLANNNIDGVLWELVNDPDTRRNLNRARGYCREHAWLLVRHGASLGVAILMQDVIKTLLAVLETTNFEKSPAAPLDRIWHSLNHGPSSSKATAGLLAELSPQQPCPVCVATERAENYYLEALLKYLTGSANLLNIYRASDGFCLPHFQQTLARVTDEPMFSLLVEAQKAVWRRLEVDLGEFIRKNNYLFQKEGFGQEGDAWRRAIEAVSGAPPAKVQQ
jgi:hypothetical protein